MINLFVGDFKKDIETLEPCFSIRLYNDRKKEMLVIQDRTYNEVLGFVESMQHTDQDYCITHKNSLYRMQKSEVEKELSPFIRMQKIFNRQILYFC